MLKITIDYPYLYLNNKKYKCTYVVSHKQYQAKVPIPNPSKKKAYYGKTLLEIKTKILNALNCESTQEESPDKNIIQQHVDNTNQRKLATEVFEDMFHEKIESNPKSTYLTRIERVYKMYIEPVISKKFFDEITITDISNILNTGFERNFKKKSMNKFLEILYPTFELALDEGYITKSPLTARKLKMLRKKIENNTPSQSKSDNYNSSDLKNITDITEKYYLSSERTSFRYFPAFIFLINTGCRIGELCALKHSDIIYEGNTKFISINKTVQCKPILTDKFELTGNQELAISNSPKTKSGNRNIPLNEQALYALDLMKESDKKFNITSDFIFSRLDGNFSSTNMLRKSFNLLKELTGINKGSVHSLRHLFSSLLTSKNTNLKVHSYLMGHSSGHFSTDVYSSALIKDIVDATKNLTDYADTY
ncbi:site-specific integrase [Clostridium butyricum]|uniref:Site-specific recombinase, phage integrase family n=1 Tax=Clostridium butyricum E4 str. BoNT E BL5262 TaxID=632245 RepID=C4IHC1_CLOBU|nr:site-specific integrase [Clostridium butyricum]EDT75453.1 site-specific recombinase, phage integrase family protein [Clostridium butyricum 5521]EEP54003.1 site-specific recombinase, phage integrase family [Clostridium butyricum E4 str. BoNT E BL5262]NFL30262.1 site-specific integrase [Clostridium butyricum]NFS17636.1 site-specific integrase [Clostridium butyricum]